MVNAVMETVTPILIVAVFKTTSVPDVPTEKSATCVEPSDCTMRPHVAVLAARPVVLLGSVGLSTPAAAPAANGDPIVNSASSVVAAPPVAGREPS